jgi:hypothetical protein
VQLVEGLDANDDGMVTFSDFLAATMHDRSAEILDERARRATFERFEDFQRTPTDSSRDSSLGSPTTNVDADGVALWLGQDVGPLAIDSSSLLKAFSLGKQPFKVPSSAASSTTGLFSESGTGDGPETISEPGALSEVSGISETQISAHQEGQSIEAACEAAEQKCHERVESSVSASRHSSDVMPQHIHGDGCLIS